MAAEFTKFLYQYFNMWKEFFSSNRDSASMMRLLSFMAFILCAILTLVWVVFAGIFVAFDVVEKNMILLRELSYLIISLFFAGVLGKGIQKFAENREVNLT